MTEQEQRIAIAEVCGWEFRPYADSRAWWLGGSMVWSEQVRGLSERTPTDPLPDYLNDLNAMHEAESYFFEKDDEGELPAHDLDESDYAAEVLRAMGKEVDYEYGIYCLGGILHATADQRAEAFLKTLNLWTDE